MKIDINENAAMFLKEKILESKRNLCVRVYIKGFNWGSATLGLALDELGKEDRVYEIEGIKFIMDKNTSRNIKGIKVDISPTIFGNRVVVEDLYKANSGCC